MSSLLCNRPARVSFEFFPARDASAAENLWNAVLNLGQLRPEFVSVTYGAGGTSRDPSFELLRRLATETDLPAAAHLTAVSGDRMGVDRVARDFASLGIRRFVALRGDTPGGIGGRYRPDPQAYANGAELVAGLGGLGDFDVSVAAYPEKHPESPDFATDIEMLKRKVDAGAARALTQYFFDNDAYERYVERARRSGIFIPIVPGILPVHNFRQVASFSARCGAIVPQWLADRFDGLENKPKIHEMVAVAIAAEQVHDLMRRGVAQFHFYTMNRAELVMAICQMMGIRPVALEAGSAAA